MGKTELLNELGARIGVAPIRAGWFLNAPVPSSSIHPGLPLLIDAVDEVVSNRDGDVIDRLMAQIERSGARNVILGCRALEWDMRGERGLKAQFGAAPRVFVLAPFSRAEAFQFLEGRHPCVDPAAVLTHLEEHSLAELYGNPLTLDLLGRVASGTSRLPRSRADLFELVCAHIWMEHDRYRQASGLGQLSESAALDAAGAIGAALILSGAVAASTAGAGFFEPGDVRISDVASLPNAGAARTILASKLFRSITPDRAEPLHRVIAEYLGARWLARQVEQHPRARRRLMAQLTGAGRVPAALRGLHAWLAHHCPVLAEEIISNDPFGFMQYAETIGLTVAQSEHLLDALSELAETDPLFRISDLSSRGAAGLVKHLSIVPLRAIIGSPESNGHLRSLLIEAMKNNPEQAGELGETLEAVLLSADRFYRERNAAMEALFPLRDAEWARGVVGDLLKEGREDGARLAHAIIEGLHSEIDDELLIATCFAEIGALTRAWPKEGEPIYRLTLYDRMFSRIPSERIRGLLDLAVSYSQLIEPSDFSRLRDAERLASQLIARAIDEGVVGPADAAAFWRWLSMLQPHRGYRDGASAVMSRLRCQVELRRAVQAHVLFEERPDHSLLESEFALEERGAGLRMYEGDALWFLERHVDRDRWDEKVRADWRDLLSLAVLVEGFTAEVGAAADRFIREDTELLTFKRKLESPPKSDWQIRQEHDDAVEARP